MGISYEYTPSILLCAEENHSIFCLDEEEEVVQRNWSDLSPQPKSSGLYGTSFNVFPLQSDECLDLLIERETKHMPSDNYTKRLASGSLDVSIRTDAIDCILMAHAYNNFGPLSAYLSVNYLDRFLSSYELPKGKTWMAQLLAVACLSLAAKMEEATVPLFLDLQVAEAKFVFEARTIQRMELLLLSTLKWRMQSVTPFSFIECFLRKLNGGDLPSELSISRAVKLILGTIKGIGFLSFKPSEIAAAIAIWVKGEANAIEVEKTITYSNKIDKERVLRCYKVMQEELLMTCVESADNKNWDSSVTYMPQSPIGVLDAACLSYKSDEMTSSSQPSSHHSSPAEKRRKISRPSFS
ncbi:cyclin-D4-1 [Dendrobium catenatum]|uniref:Cyclin-D3-1 n=1 Tax=Dendrobium catenatum TaxID=906689 RepID=A0A2I0VR76_9ASPA|nr:cyclin-D4-1 [Dendrobium catenatum]PKU65907.1 Cyclin-D3-1 [Dendrobium catenatum]